MPKTIPAAGEAMSNSEATADFMKTTRRTFLRGAAVAALPVTAGACIAVTATQTEAAVPVTKAENPDLLNAFERLKAADAEVVEARSALEWLADEGRHRWPLAPECILGGANADSGFGSCAHAERDIIGRFIRRDTSVLLERLSPRWRRESPRLCFSIETVEDLEERIHAVRNRKPRGRTEATRKQYRAEDEALLNRYLMQVEVAREYHAETARLRKLAGVDQAKARIKAAEAAYRRASDDVSRIPAFGPEGLKIKLAAMDTTGFREHFSESPGIVGEMARFIQQVIDMNGRASA